MERVYACLAAVLALALVGLPSGAAAADVGLKVYIQKRCYTCHSINARSAEVEKEKAAFIKEMDVEPEEEGDKESRGGDLSDAGKKREPAWLREFLKSPKGHFKDDAACQRTAKKKDLKKFKGTPEELDALMAFLQGLKQEAKQAPGFASCIKE